MKISIAGEPVLSRRRHQIQLSTSRYKAVEPELSSPNQTAATEHLDADG